MRAHVATTPIPLVICTASTTHRDFAFTEAEPHAPRTGVQPIPVPTANDLFVRWRANDDAAGETLYRSYRRLVQWAVRTYLPQRLRRRLDHDDMVQSVFLVLFEKGRKHRLRWANDLAFRCWLVKFTIHHVLKEARKHSALRRNTRREENCELGGLAAPVKKERFDVHDLLDTADPVQRRIIELLLQGYSRQETAVQLGLTTRTVLRKLNHLRERIFELDPELRSPARPCHHRVAGSADSTDWDPVYPATCANKPRVCSIPGEMARA